MILNSNRRSLEDWVDYIQGLHHRQIDLTLDRVREVYRRLLPAGFASKVVTISGTNGKGSTAELLASIYRQGGYKVGKYTSPHLVQFNERINIDGKPVDDQSLLESFERVEGYRLDTPITFFEFGTLVAIDLFHQSKIDIAIMEVGLGGRLDAVNILDSDVGIVTSISLDHTSWLGNTIDEISFEKIGIARAAKPIVIGLPKPPKAMLKYAEDIKAEIQIIEKDFNYCVSNEQDSWSWSNAQTEIENLPLPYGQGGVQFQNCAIGLQAINQMQQLMPLDVQAIKLGIRSAIIQGRCQVLEESPLVILDVSHNESSVGRLYDFLQIERAKTKSNGKILAVCGMLLDKEIGASLQQLSDCIDEWYVASIHNERGATASQIKKEIEQVSKAQTHCFDFAVDAYKTARPTLTAHDCLLVFGSFHIAGDILAFLNSGDSFDD